jgi:hypothetical protein
VNAAVLLVRGILPQGELQEHVKSCVDNRGSAATPEITLNCQRAPIQAPLRVKHMREVKT